MTLIAVLTALMMITKVLHSSRATWYDQFKSRWLYQKVDTIRPSVHVRFSNEKLFTNIHDAKCKLVLFCCPGKTIVTKKGDLKFYRTVLQCAEETRGDIQQFTRD